MTVLWPDASWLVSELDKQPSDLDKQCLVVWVGARDRTLMLTVAGPEWGRQVLITQNEKGGDWRAELYVNGTPKRGVLGVPLDEVVSTTRELLEEKA